MAMLSQSLPIGRLGCPAGVCREQAQAGARKSWKAVLAGFAAGALVMSAVAVLASGSAARTAPQPSAEQEAAAAFVRAQTPRELPPEWRWKIKAVDVDRMFRKMR